MNKNVLNYMLMAALLGGLSTSFTACSDDDSVVDDGTALTDVTTSVATDYLTRGIETDVHSAIVEVPVKSDGEWAALLPRDVDWVHIDGRTVLFSGDQNLRLVFDENRTKADRRTLLRILSDDGDVLNLNVRQTQLWNGEIPDNNSAQWFGDNGLGRGLNFPYMFEGDSAINHTQTFSPASMTYLDPIFNWKVITDLQAKNGPDGNPLLSRDAYVENRLEAVQYDDLMHDSLVHGKDSIGVTFDLEIGFGFVEFEGHGAYHAKESKDAVKMDYLISRSATVYEVFTAPGELALAANDLGGESEVTDEQYEAQLAKIQRKEANYKKANQAKYKRKADATPEQLVPDYLEDWQQEILDAEYEKLGMPDYANIFSKAFGRLYFNLTRAVQQGDDAKKKNLLEQLDANYGPVFVGRAWYGGSINMRVQVDKDSIDVNGRFSGTIAGGVENIFHIEGKIDYVEEATRYIRNNNSTIGVYGGNAVETANAITGHFNSNAATDRDNLLTILQKWGQSLQETKDDNGSTVPSRAAMQSMQLQGIWTLFDDADVAEEVKEFMYERHPKLTQFVGAIVSKVEDK